MKDSMVKKFVISGRVQGVWYRKSTQTQALKLHLHGWANNLPNGDVEVIACGDSQAISALQSWLSQGPSGAMVVKVVEHPIKPGEHQHFSDFTTL